MCLSYQVYYSLLVLFFYRGISSIPELLEPVLRPRTAKYCGNNNNNNTPRPCDLGLHIYFVPCLPFLRLACVFFLSGKASVALPSRILFFIFITGYPDLPQAPAPLA